MLRERTGPPRDQDAERRERMRYRVLEYLYLLAGENCASVIHDSQIEQELGIPLTEVEAVASDLERLGFLQRFAEGTRLGITETGADYLSRGAWRRRSIRN